MNSSEEGSAEVRQLSPAEVIQMVEDGLFSPAHAEKWAKDHNYRHLRLDRSTALRGRIGSPTLDTSDGGGVVHLAVPTCGPSSVEIGSDRMEKMGCCRARLGSVRSSKKCRLADFGQPETWDVFSEAMQDPQIPLLQRVVRTQSSPSLSDLKADPSYGRLKKALQSGILSCSSSGERTTA